MDKLKRKSKAHTRYKNAAGKAIPGCTTITGQLNKPALVPWANNLGLQGIKASDYVDELADVGTLAHRMIECDMLGVECPTSDFTQDQIDLAENAFLKYLNWREGKEIVPIGNEMKLVSERYQFGGTCDIYCMLNGVFTLIDIKTSKGVWDEHKIQTCAYKMLLQENGYDVDAVKILRVGRDDSEGFEEITITNKVVCWQIFEHLLAIYYLKKQLKG